MKEGLTIGELAERCGVSRDAIRFYERKGLLPRPRRSASQYRLYGAEDQERVAFIRQAQALGLTLEDVRELARQQKLRSPGECQRVASLLRERIEAVDRKLAELRAFRRHLAESLERCEAGKTESCPVILDLSRSAATAARRKEIGR
jgi:DNA-binding transcriptional MerR regulator